MSNTISFFRSQWFMDNVAYDVEAKYPLPSENVFWGEIVQDGGYTCWDTYGHSWGETIGASPCHHGGGNQMFRYAASSLEKKVWSCFIFPES